MNKWHFGPTEKLRQNWPVFPEKSYLPQQQPKEDEQRKEQERAPYLKIPGKVRYQGEDL